MEYKVGTPIKVVYQDGELTRAIRGEYAGEDDNFITVKIRNYTVKIAFNHIYKIEAEHIREMGL